MLVVAYEMICVVVLGRRPRSIRKEFAAQSQAEDLVRKLGGLLEKLGHGVLSCRSVGERLSIR